MAEEAQIAPCGKDRMLTGFMIVSSISFDDGVDFLQRLRSEREVTGAFGILGAKKSKPD